MKRKSDAAALKNQWGTPKQVFTHWDKDLHFVADMAASDRNHLCDQYVTKQENAHSFCWATRYWTDRSLPAPCVWVNSPFKQESPSDYTLEDWIKKALTEANYGLKVCMLLPYQGAKYWDSLIFTRASKIWLIGGRLAFIDPITGKEANNCKFPAAIVLFDNPQSVSRADIKWISQEDIGIYRRKK